MGSEARSRSSLSASDHQAQPPRSKATNEDRLDAEVEEGKLDLDPIQGDLTQVRLEEADILVVLNPVSGQTVADSTRAILKETFGKAGLSYFIYETTGEDDIAALVRRAKEGKARLVVASGGDGTISLVADGVIGTDLPLGILPSGTGNVLSIELGIPQTIQQAAELIVGEHEEREIDAMKAGDRHFVLQLGTGLDALMIQGAPREAKRRFGRLAYFFSLAAAAFGFRATRFSLSIDGKKMRVRAWELLVANAGALGSPTMRWGPNIYPWDGKLDVVQVDVRNPFDYVRLAWQLITRHQRPAPSLHYFTVRKSVTIASDDPLPIQADGEIIGLTPITVTVAPGALRIIVPKNAPIPQP